MWAEINRRLKKRESFAALCVVLFLIYFISVAQAEYDYPENLAGPPFSDPLKTMEMPADWVKQSIKYDPSEADADIVLSLDQHIYPVLLPIIQDFAKEHNIKAAVIEGTCGIAAGMLSRKAADIGGFCCPPDKTDRLPGLRFHTYGIGALTLLVHPDNSVDNITIEEAKKIFTGEIVSWAEIKTNKGEKGLQTPIQPVTRLHCKIRPGHWRLLLDNQDLFGPGIQEVGAIPDMIYRVASNQRAIGFEILWNVERFKEKGAVKALKLNGYSPYDQNAIAAHGYPLYEVFSLTTWEGKGVENPWAQKLIEYILKQTEQLDKRYNFVPSSQLKKAGWKFKDYELIGEPE